MKCLFKSYPVIIEYKIWQTPNTNVLFWDFPLRIEENETKYFTKKKLDGLGGDKVEIVEIFPVKLVREEKRLAGQEMETEEMQSQITSDRFHQHQGSCGIQERGAQAVSPLAVLVFSVSLEVSGKDLFRPQEL